MGHNYAISLRNPAKSFLILIFSVLPNTSA
jgi:hypothetical protein